MALNDIMEFDHVIEVHADGTVSDAAGIYAPEVHVDTDDGGQILPVHEKEMIESVRAQGWELMDGYSGQWGPSELIGGGLERDILGEPGTYVAVVVQTPDGESDIWAVARKL